MAIRGDGKRLRKGIAFLHHDLMPNASSRGVEVDALLAGKYLNLAVLFQILGRLVLNIVVERKDDLRGVLDLGRSDGSESVLGSVSAQR